MEKEVTINKSSNAAFAAIVSGKPPEGIPESEQLLDNLRETDESIPIIIWVMGATDRI